MARILIADRDEQWRAELAETLREAGHDADHAGDAETALALARAQARDAVCLNLALSGGNDLLARLRTLPDPPEVIALAPGNDPAVQEEALRNGAWECLDAPCPPESALASLLRALRSRALRADHEPRILQREEIIGESPRLRASLDRLAQAASCEVDVLITGETGTGKELFARAIHENSRRRQEPFVVVDCTALPATLAESILFGHARGAFTGADTARDGLVREAHGGTLFLDEVGELPLDMQAKFLRVLQERRFRPVGSTREVESRFRLVAATNRDIAAMAEERAFRPDLMFRLRAFVIALPPLRERKDDIKDLVHHYLARTGGRFQGGIKGLSPDFVQALWRHHWPGNVRELFQVLETSLVSAQAEPILYPQHLPVELRVKLVRDASHPAPPPPGDGREGMPMPGLQPWREYRDKALDVIERLYFRDLAAHCRGDMLLACRLSGLKPARLYQLMRKHGAGRSGRGE
ncbi:sigma-54 dependent transcriptional regulator [Desulfovibrio aminophilus]|nr:sigma-54 dependent transcriptional regulator [Desulfovibrio aminophilus]MCM0755742.1 sigma-54 dependent transcriptional regulator [Desulfovibrio aminophilus]